MTIREATAADTGQLTVMALHFVRASSYYSLLTPSVALLEHSIALVIAQGVILVVEVDGALVGFLALLVAPQPFTGELFADEVAWWVEPDARSGFVGSRLLQAGEAWARARGLTLMTMIAPVDTAVGRYYQRCGYQAIETRYVKSL